HRLHHFSLSRRAARDPYPSISFPSHPFGPIRHHPITLASHSLSTGASFFREFALRLAMAQRKEAIGAPKSSLILPHALRIRVHLPAASRYKLCKTLRRAGRSRAVQPTSSAHSLNNPLLFSGAKIPSTHWDTGALRESSSPQGATSMSVLVVFYFAKGLH